MRQILLFAIFVFITVLSLIPPAFAKEMQMEDQQASVPPIVKYDLAFPGILPDHPLYKLKVLRNKLSAALISISGCRDSSLTT